MKKSVVVAVFVVMQSIFCSDVFSANISGNIIENDHYESFSFDSTAKGEINSALGITGSNPIYFIVVTRQSDKLYKKLDNQTDGAELNKILRCICGDNAGDSDDLKDYNDMHAYVKAHKDELARSCKIVVFNEHFFYRSPLNETEYNEFMGDRGWLSDLSASCSKAIFYPNFLRIRAFSSPQDEDCRKRYNQTIDQRSVLLALGTTRNMQCNIEDRLVNNLARNLLNNNLAQQYTKEEVDKLAADLGIVDFLNPQAVKAEYFSTLCNYLKVPILQVDEHNQYAAKLAYYLAVSKGSNPPGCHEAVVRELQNVPPKPLTSALKSEVAGELNAVIELARGLSENVDGLGNVSAAFAHGLKTSRGQILSTVTRSYESARINTNTLMLPIKKPDNIISNVTYSVCRGRILTQYEKGTYFQEADCNIGFTSSNDLKKSIYSFGIGSDSAVEGELDNQLEGVQRALLRNISTELCYDLCRGVRRSNGWSNKGQQHQSKLHILQSNYIDTTGRTYCSSPNITHLPISTKENNICILQADSSPEPRAGSHLFKINSSGAPILHEKEKDPSPAELEIGGTGIKITVYKLD